MIESWLGTDKVWSEDSDKKSHRRVHIQTLRRGSTD